MERIEPATAADVPQLADLLAVLFTQEAEFSAAGEKQARGLRLIIDHPDRGRIFVARVADNVAGMVSLLFTVSTAEGAPACWLEDMVVHPDQRGKGLGTRLLRHAVDYARANGFARITLLTDRTNDRAIRFYQRQGFRPSPMIPLRLYP
jgi:ribosomal protein S18 acetylase RimI-like enzyme